jgi:membrane-associated phospholipid phosphatase
MSGGQKAKAFVIRYMHAGWFLLYSAFYLVGFSLVERAGHIHYHMIHTWLDDQIPFCEYFIVPYYLWFGLIAWAVCYFIFCVKDRNEYYKMISMLMIGMTLFLIVSVVYPNKLDLRPASVDTSNVFGLLVSGLYRTDTPTNVLPSIHVFNTMAILYAVNGSDQLRKKKVTIAVVNILSILIILATMFLKQHSVIDVSLGIVMSVILQVICDRIYETGTERVLQPEAQPQFSAVESYRRM